MFVVIIFFAFQMVIFYTTNEISTAANTTLNVTHASTVSLHMIRIIDIFKIIMVLCILGFGGAFLLSAGLNLKEYIGGDRFYES